ncbi:MAG: protein-(glutamine-N5) methyltransferase, release factor-specific [Candidatus Magasanikbacteria bacterium RIFCSPHIGHO2_01_FULL_33_34]|uniref:Protein-(Glutamine-N5) methyltransferase, release factor-specific n=1 Tax=Candidatus Magasanikbacteria bacterium RIFCSPHIGHO2_01_FULL_33_34 TaxID=1798671 RepID=A0A1F6LKB1_9BACT|nr:MAG: protein-(glutamine-N5) methyltransferase, release factor-specific [Candidatus Magasanikbacteria bacterium RIFCSPHIGHO2_01_FULL_33_34]
MKLKNQQVYHLIVYIYFMRQTITQLLQHANKDIDIYEAEILLSHVLKKTKEYIISNPKIKVNLFVSYKYKKLIKKRSKGIPIAYLTGHKEFFGLNFFINKYTLIPRPDTEILVESVLNYITNKNILIDIGTGSGCIPISILKNKKVTTAYATDISKKALKIANKNAHSHNVKITFLQGSLLEPLIDIIKNIDDIYITANLPYLTEEQFKTEKSIQYEPKSALVAKNNGLDLYEKLLHQIKTFSNKTITAFFEIDPSQSKNITNLIKKIFTKSKIEIKKDLSNYDRVIIIKIVN